MNACPQSNYVGKTDKRAISLEAQSWLKIGCANIDRAAGIKECIPAERVQGKEDTVGGNVREEGTPISLCSCF